MEPRFEAIVDYCSLVHIGTGHDCGVAQAGVEEVSVVYEDSWPGDAGGLGLVDDTCRRVLPGITDSGDNDIGHRGQIPEVMGPIIPKLMIPQRTD